MKEVSRGHEKLCQQVMAIVIQKTIDLKQDEEKEDEHF